MGSASPSYRGHRYPVEVISHCMWLYRRFPLSFREIPAHALATLHACDLDAACIGPYLVEQS